jgi:hypothetical protein
VEWFGQFCESAFSWVIVEATTGDKWVLDNFFFFFFCKKPSVEHVMLMLAQLWVIFSIG